MNILKNHIVAGSQGRPVLVDAYYLPDGNPKPVVLFAHGFKGFKDWGHWHLIFRRMALEGFVCLKFNFSHNGTTPAHPDRFDDLEAFGQNNYSKELFDLEQVINWLEEQDEVPEEEMELSRLTLIGHSRGGPIVLIQAARDERVGAVVTWASVKSLDYAWEAPGLIEDWKQKGVYYVLNGRTGQEMPLYYQMYEDFIQNRELLDSRKALNKLEKPGLIIHGTQDPAVPAEHAQKLKEWQPRLTLYLIQGADHVFGGRHPYSSEDLPDFSRELVEQTVHFLNDTF
jgi:pimeloyl-ACP methyl ester carboxylesterase